MPAVCHCTTSPSARPGTTEAGRDASAPTRSTTRAASSCPASAKFVRLRGNASRGSEARRDRPCRDSSAGTLVHGALCAVVAVAAVEVAAGMLLLPWAWEDYGREQGVLQCFWWACSWGTERVPACPRRVGSSGSPNAGRTRANSSLPASMIGIAASCIARASCASAPAPVTVSAGPRSRGQFRRGHGELGVR